MKWISLTLEQKKELAEKAHYSSMHVAKLCQLSQRQLERQFRQAQGCSPQSWLDEQRISAAGALLLSGKPVKAVAYDLGFKQASHFCRKFKKHTKMTTSEFVESRSGGSDFAASL